MIGIDSVTWNGDLGHTLTFGEGGYKKKREDGCFMHHTIMKALRVHGGGAKANNIT